MTVGTNDIKVFGSASMVETEGSTDNQGGLIATNKKVTFTDLTANSALEVLTSVTSDNNKKVKITGRDSEGVIQEAVATLGNVADTAVATSPAQVFERILKIELRNNGDTAAVTSAGTITVRTTVGSNELATLETGINEVRRPFYGAVANVQGGATKNYYEKIFIKNTNNGTALTKAKLIESTGGSNDGSGLISFALDTALNGNSESNDRATAPSTGVGSFNDGDTAVDLATGNLTPGDAQGVWLKLTLDGGTAPDKKIYTLRVTGETV